MKKLPFGERLSARMRLRGYDVAGLSALLQIRPQTIRAYLRGEHYPKRETFIKIVRADYLLGLSCEPKRKK